jgi:integrase
MVAGPRALPRIKSEKGEMELLLNTAVGFGAKDLAKAIQCDMRDCGLPVVTPAGRRSFHSLRNSYISGLLDAGVDVATVQQLARHADVTMTISYARLRPDSERQAVTTLPGLGL